ncbi:ABC transporter permease [Rossellomorea aquimaris]|uniref:ABC transporter permease subunit n=1 Tax=Rossellomorea aquimaris TaxID=189382 RepID=UPI001CD5EB2E|nr:ABC transporter permease subunit [Rossellomorea aquimaris]MCA1055800.1 ABC transporter permease [Rossellomorea aquimaris]
MYWRELKSHRKSLIFWCIGMIALIGSGMGKYAGFTSSGQSLNDLMASMPKVMQTFMGVGSLDMTTAIGYYGLLFMYIVLLATIHSVLLGATILSKEERDKTVEFLFVKPVTRVKVVAVKLLAALTNAGVLLCVTWISSVLIVGHYAEGEDVSGDIGMFMVGLILLQILFIVVGMAVAAISKRPGKSSVMAAAILLVTFVLSFAIDLSEKIEGMKYLTPFKYFEAKTMLGGGGFEPVFLVLSIVLIVLFGTMAFWFYRKRDLKV